MEELHTVRRSLETDDRTHEAASFASDVDIRRRAALPAGLSPAEVSAVDPKPKEGGHANQIPFYKRRWFIVSHVILGLIGFVMLFILLFPVLRALVELVIRKSTLDVQNAKLIHLYNDSFTFHMDANIAHTSTIPGIVYFTEPITISWAHEGNVTQLGTIRLQDPLETHHSRAIINRTLAFNITDVAAFSTFSRFMVVSPNFTWVMQSSNVRVRAAKFPLVKGISFTKHVTLQGLDSFKDAVTLKDLQLPGDNPAGGINFVAVAEIMNKSPFSLDLGTVVFRLQYQNVYLATGTSKYTNIVKGSNTVSLSGYLVRHDNDADLTVLSRLLTNYINDVSTPVLAFGQSTLENGGVAVPWLSSALEGLALTVPMKPPSHINTIDAISIGELSLAFNPQTPWAPTVQSNSLSGSIKLPFGFNVSMSQIRTDFNICRGDVPLAGLSAPPAAALSSFSVLGPTDTEGTINITIANTSLVVPESQHEAFSSFAVALTTSPNLELTFAGSVSTVANTSIGVLPLGPINIAVSTNVDGLNGFNGITIDGVDVTGGTVDGINIEINVTMFNPSRFRVYVGDLTLQLFRNEALLGEAVIPNFSIDTGNNSVTVHSSLNPNDVPGGPQTLSDFVAHKDIQMTISGFKGSTNVASIAEAMQNLHVNVTLPGLQSDLVSMASFTVLPTTAKNNISHVQVTMHNPFSADLHVTYVKATVSSFGIPLGTMDSATDFRVAGKVMTKSPELSFTMNLDPPALLTVMRGAALEAGLDVAPLDAIAELGGYHYLTPTNNSIGERQTALFKGFDLPSFVQKAFQKLKGDVHLVTNVSIGDYSTTLELFQSGIPTVADASVNLLFPILSQPIVQRIVANAALNVDNILMSNPQQHSFDAHVKGSIRNTGPFDGTISFPSGLMVSWDGKPLGNLQMKEVHIVGDNGADMDLNTSFDVADVAVVTDFAKVLLTQQSFEWVISGENLTVSALGVSIPGVMFSAKQVTMQGLNNLKGGIQVETFDLPSNDPAGGVRLMLNGKAANPSQVGVDLSSVTFYATVGDVVVASVQSAGHLSITPLSTTALSLTGRLLPQTTTEGLATVSTIVNNYLHGIDNDIVVQGASAGTPEVTWLNEAFKTLKIQTVLPSRGVSNIINSVSINQMTILFNDNIPYNPLASSHAIVAAFQSPFGFPLDIRSLEQTLTMSFEGASFAELKIPRVPTVTDIQKSSVKCTFDNVPLNVFDDQHGTFERFIASATTGKQEEVQISGFASGDVMTGIGLISLQNITFAVKTEIPGIQGFNSVPPLITSMDVSHGYPDYLLIKANTTLFNPSVITIGAGDVSFSLQFEGQTIGSADANNLTISPGNVTYPIDVHYAPQGDAIPTGRTLLQNFLQGTDVKMTIKGTTDSTQIESLRPALSQFLFAATIPAWKNQLIKSASLTFPTDVVTSHIALTSVTLTNPFTANIDLLKVKAAARFDNLILGTIDKDVSENPIKAKGHSSTESPRLPLNFNLDALTIVKVFMAASKLKNMDLGPLAQLFQFVIDDPNFNLPIVTHVDTNPPVCISGQQFDFSGTIIKVLSGIPVDLQLQASVKLDDYATDLAFEQKAVPVNVDSTALYLIGVAAGPIIQRIMDNAVLSFRSAQVINVSDNGFDFYLTGSFTNVGPLDGLITFVEPLNVNWNGQDIAQLHLDPVCLAANRGLPDYRSNAKLIITDEPRFTSFAAFLLHNPTFEWTISTEKLRITALGTVFDNVPLSKKLSFNAFNGFSGISVGNFNLPSDDPAGGIRVEAEATIPSLSQLGIELGTVTFQSFFGKTLIGSLMANNLSLAPQSETVLHLSGRIIPQTGSDLANSGQLFSAFLAGRNVTLLAKGGNVIPPGASKPVKWLSDAFSTLELPVILPGKQYNIIQSVELNGLEMTLLSQEQAFAPLSSCDNALAKFQNPFGFALQILSASQNMTLRSQETDVAELLVPLTMVESGISKGDPADLRLSFKNLPLTALNKSAFQQMFVAVTLQSTVDLQLRGIADVTVRTSIGDIPILGVPFNAASQLQGVNAFGHTASLRNVSVSGSGGQGGNEYVVAPATAVMENPSNLSLVTNDVSLPVTYQGVLLGRTAINSFDLHPGMNVISAEFHYQPTNANDTIAQSFLSRFIQTPDTIPVEISGDYQSSPYESLQLALASLHVTTALKGLNIPNFITHINVYVAASVLVTGTASVDVDMHNPLDADMVVEFVQADAGVNGQTYTQMSYAFQNFVIPAGATINSGRINNAPLTRGVVASLGLLPLGYIDIRAAATIRVGSANGYQVPWLQVQQTHVPATYQVSLLG